MPPRAEASAAVFALTVFSEQLFLMNMLQPPERRPDCSESATLRRLL
jgi:hypothetical protein